MAGEPSLVPASRRDYGWYRGSSATGAVTSPPRILSLSASIGYAGDTITITGVGLSLVTQVLFGGIPAQFTIVNDYTITVIVPLVP